MLQLFKKELLYLHSINNSGVNNIYITTMLQLLYKICNISCIYTTLKKYMVHFCSYIYNCNYTKTNTFSTLKQSMYSNIFFLCRLNFNDITKYQLVVIITLLCWCSLSVERESLLELGTFESSSEECCCCVE